VAIGYLGYDLGYDLEGITSALPRDLPLPELWFGLFPDSAWLAPDGTITGGGPARELLSSLARTPTRRSAPAAVDMAVRWQSPFARRDYEAAVATIQQRIVRGELFQANLTQPFRGAFPMPTRQAFARLMATSPAPFAAYLELDRNSDSRAVLSASPEEFLFWRNGAARTRPIKGTRQRGANPHDDARLREELLQSSKDRAELTMIVDLLRNDLGKSARFGSVRVSGFPELMTLPQVHHLHATVEAETRATMAPLEVLRRMFPGGSITGAPKLAAMRCIDELERTRRGAYTGAIGYVAPGRAHFNVAIRTLLVADGQARLAVGGGIVADSVPALEYEETLVKARGVAAAAGVILEDATGARVG
jgi:para-aminobenzoate synthetase component 1